ncbi:MAG: HAD-IC family P-type ATPase, partial [Candidatus Promineifilaceae bacterium]|nr:HAD-IC family P-type ATPase [Candidatus Promineifilaceae bacterium]
RDDVLFWAAVAESGSEHPLARSIVEAASDLDRDVPSSDSFSTRTGRGVYATYTGRTIGVGTPELMAELEVNVPAEATEHMHTLQEQGKTAVLVAVDGAVIGVLGIADTLRASAPTMLQRLEEIGLEKVVMLTGDDQVAAEAIAAEAGIGEVHARLLPEEKQEVVRRLQQKGHVVAMLGDGINDAPALAAADVGIAMGAAGTDIAVETADVALMADDLMKVPEAIHLSRATLSNIRQNVAIALVTVAGLLAGVLLGQVHMAGGMLIHEASVMVVILNGMRLLRA